MQGNEEWLNKTKSKLSGFPEVNFKEVNNSGYWTVGLNITSTLERIFGEKIVLHGEQNITEIFSHINSDEDIDNTFEKIKDIFSDKETTMIDMENGNIEIEFVSGNKVNLSVSEWGTIRKIK